MGEPVFNRKKRYVNKEGRKYGQGVWLNSNGGVIKPGQGFLTKDGKVVQYNTDGTRTTYTRSQWQDKKTKEHELQVLQNDRKYAIPYIPSKKMTITIDRSSPTRKNAGATFSENLLDSIAVNASKARIPFSTALGLVAQESTLGHNPERTIGTSLEPWLGVLYNGNDKYTKAADKISYKNAQSPSLLTSNWKTIFENPFSAYQYDEKLRLRKSPQSEDYYNDDFAYSLGRSNNYQVKDVSPLFKSFREYKKDPTHYNPGDSDYPNKVEAQRQELINHSPEIKSYMGKRNLHSDGGYLENDWSRLSYKDKAEMMKVAIANGITSLPEIREAYNKFAKGGRMKWTMQDEAGYRYWRSKLPRNLRETNDADYDMRAAYKAGMEPQWDNKDKSYHLGSRDPYSGRILKSAHHPTFLKALVTDASLGYYPTMDGNGNTYTETWKGNTYADGGYIPSDSIKKRISDWEGASMKTNRSFEAEAQDFNRVVPSEIRSKLSPNQLDALYSYGYNVGMGKLKERVLPTLTAYTQGKASREDVQRSMWATKDSQLRGLTKRRNAEREMFGGNYRTTFDDKNMGIHVDPESLQLSKGFFDDVSSMINTGIPQMPLPDTMSVDPITLYKAPIINDNIPIAPVAPKEEYTYNPRQEKLDNLKKFNTIMGLMGEQTPLTGLIEDSEPGLLSYINAIYKS